LFGPKGFLLFLHLEEAVLTGEVEEFAIEFGEAFEFGIVLGDLAAAVGLDARDEALHLPLLLLALGIAVSVHGEAVGVDGPFALLQRLTQVGIDSKTAHQTIATLDVDVDIGQGLELGGIFVISVFQQFYPEAQPADLDTVGIDVHAKETVFYYALLLVK